MKLRKKLFFDIKFSSNILAIILASIIILVALILSSSMLLIGDQSNTIDNKLKNETAESDINNSTDYTDGGNSKDFPKDGKVKLYRTEKNKIEEVDLEEYIMGVVSSEVPADFEEESLKAQAIAARTYYINRRTNPCDKAKEHGGEICDTTNCQVYMDKDERISKWSKANAESNWSKIENAVKSTEGEILTYDGNVIKYPLFFSTSSGKTEDSQDVFAMDVPYLKSQESKGEEVAPKYESTVNISKNDFINKIKAKYNNSNIDYKNLEDKVKIQSNTEAGSVKEIKIGGVTISGKDFRSIFNLNSSNFVLNFNNTFIEVKCKGYGHGVGMSQWGANVMAKNGSDYKEILKHYYNGVEIEKINYVD